jgi:EAL domain-containing protein (putative c-di-GMP-specific phosphodiesterase class I)
VKAGEGDSSSAGGARAEDGGTRPPVALVVDDDPGVLRAHARTLSRHGYRVETACDGEEAERAIRATAFDVILSDIDMPGMDGVALLERVRAHDLDVPVLLITGAPSVETAVRAIQHGALRYLLKPVEPKALVKELDDAVRLHRLARAKRQALDLAGGLDRLVGDHAGLVASFGRALDGFDMAYQPIVSWSRRAVFAHEALLRPREPSLPHPGAMFDAAERLGRVRELSRRIRRKAIEPLEPGDDQPLLFINLDPSDLADDDLLSPDAPLSRLAGRVVLEITERASLPAAVDVRRRVAVLRERGFRIAIDDLGAGYAGLTSFAVLEPDIVKLDMGLVRDLHREPTKRTLVRTIVSMCRELGIEVTAEGVEVAEERDELLAAGCDLLQGYLFARPGPAFPAPSF